MSRGALVAVSVGLLSLGLSGCLSVAGGETQVVQPHTLGKELQDLKAARDTGAVTADEYDLAKHRLIAQGKR